MKARLLFFVVLWLFIFPGTRPVGFAEPPKAGEKAMRPPKANEKMDQAIERALGYLKNRQQVDGSWGGSPAYTSLSVMAFLAAGHIPGEGKYADNVEKGVRWVMSKQQSNGLLATTGAQGAEMYHHGISTLMLAEVVGMTQGNLAKEVKEKLEKAVKVILESQRTQGDDAGGWRYQMIGNTSDMSVTGWQVLSLAAAKNVGCDIPAENIEKAVNYILRSRDESSGGFKYTPRRGHVTVPCTGTAILCLEVCGKNWHNTDMAKAAGDFILKQPSSFGLGHFSYYIYYCSQATFQLGGKYWSGAGSTKGFRQILHELLLPTQKSDGSWAHPSEKQLGDGTYTTAMAVLALAVEYRFLPIYQRGEEPADEGGKKK